MSRDASGRERSNDEQHVDNLAAIARTPGWVLSDRPAYRDVGSASRYATKRRNDYDDMVADVRAGTFGADALQIWESSRSSRRVSEWCAFLELCAEKRVSIIVTTHGPRLYDPTNDRDWRSLMEDAVDSEYETRKTSGRARRSMASSAADGKVQGGKRAYGYSKDGRTVDPVEAEVIRECVRRILAGDSLRSLAGDLNRRGLLTSTGKQWRPNVLHRVLTGPRIVGQRIHHGVIVAKGDWPAIIDERTQRRLVATLAGRSPVGRRGRTPWLLTGLLRCELCGASLLGATRTSGTRQYICRGGTGYRGCGKLAVKANELELLLGDLAMKRLDDAATRQRSRPGSDDDDDESDELDEIALLRSEAAEDRARGPRNGGIDRRAYTDLVYALDRRQSAVEARLAAKVRQSEPIQFVITNHVGRAWAGQSVEEQRLVLNALIDHVTVAPASTPGRAFFEPERVGGDRIVWRL